MVTEVSRQVFDQRCRDGEWDVQFDVNQFGTAQVRVVRTGRSKTVKVR